jgi:hypothetical protein
MSVEKLQLPRFLIADLYKDCLVEIEAVTLQLEPVEVKKINADPEITTVHQSKTVKYLGDNHKRTIIIINDSDSVIINDTDLALLTNILKACSLNLSDIAIININKQEIQFSKIKEQLDVEKILLFDVAPSTINLPFSIPDFQVQQYAGTIILTAPSLAQLNMGTEESRLQKSKLWVSLKEFFKIA